jgi:hypothetical protein
MRNRLPVFALAIVASSLVVRTVHAQSPPEAPLDAPASPPPAAPPTPWTWYGWQILLSDGAAVATFVGAEAIAAGTPSDSAGRNVADALVALSASQYVFGGAAVQAGHRQWVRAAVSVGDRLLIPATGFVLGIAIGAGQPATESDISPAFQDALIGMLLGMAAADVVDVAALSTVRSADVPRPSVSGVEWLPFASIASDPAHRRETPIVGALGRF